MIGAPPPPRVPVPSAIVRRAREGDVWAEEELVGHFHAGLVAHLTRRVHDREAARELANDVLMATVQAMREGRVKEPERLAGFVYGIARNLANNYLRMRWARPAPEPLAADMADIDAGDRIDQRERLSRVRDGLNGLPQLERQILLLTIEGVKPGLIAERLGLSSMVVRARKSRAMRKLADRLGLRLPLQRARAPGARAPDACAGGPRSGPFRPRRSRRIR